MSHQFRGKVGDTSSLPPGLLTMLWKLAVQAWLLMEQQGLTLIVQKRCACLENARAFLLSEFRRSSFQMCCGLMGFLSFLPPLLP